MNRDELKSKIINVLKQYPNGLKAREIASKIPNADKSSINSILYANTEIFSANNYIWKWVSPTPPNKTNIPPLKGIPRISGQQKRNILPNISKTNSPVRPTKKEYVSAEKVRLCLAHPELNLNMTLAQMNDKLHDLNSPPYKKCTGNCALCNREKCIDEA